MAVYEQTYKPYGGPTTAPATRFLILPRHAFKGIFRSKVFTAFFALCYGPTLVYAIIIYLKHNVNALLIMDLTVADVVPIDAFFFRVFVGIQAYLALLVAILIGPGLIAGDIANNALPLYLARPLSRAEYALGKVASVFVPLSAITWVPGLILFGLAAYLEGFAWSSRNVRVGVAILVGSVVWIVLVTLVALSISALVKQAMAARGAMVGLFFALSAFSGIVNASFETEWGNLVSLPVVADSVWVGLFGDGSHVDLPIPAAWTVLVIVCAGCLALLARKIRAYEVVS